MTDLAPMAPENTGDGNTKHPRVAASKRWCFTYFYQVDETIGSFITKVEKMGTYFLGLETCPSTGRKHMQGYIEFDKKCRPLETVGIKEIHWEKAKGGREENVTYCGKEGNIRTNSKWEGVEVIEDPMDGVTWHKWQTDLMDFLKTKPNRRDIMWYWSKGGAKGKTCFAFHLCLKHNAIYVNGRAADIKCAIKEYLTSNKRGPRIIIFGFPRTSEGYVSYGAIEEVKDGILFSGKYESGMGLMNPPHIICFSNFKPDTGTMSEDKWVIKNID